MLYSALALLARPMLASAVLAALGASGVAAPSAAADPAAGAARREARANATANAEERFDIKIPDSAFAEMTTVGEAVDFIIESVKAARTSA